MYSPIKSLPTSLLQREENRYPPFRKGGLGGFDIENFAMLILQFACLPCLPAGRRRQALNHQAKEGNRS